MSIYIGLMSGTSVDGIDVVAVRFNDTSGSPELLHGIEHPFADELASSVHQLIAQSSHIDLNTLGALDVALGHAYADAIEALLESADIDRNDVVAIGNHGQTIRHQPDSELPFSMQIGDANIIAERTGITTVADFRRRDIAAGGQGAPLVPAFHQAVFGSDQECRVILNIGGIANITILQAETTTGFDTGPGNTLLDSACRHYQDQDYDHNGELAATGTVNDNLLEALCSHEYFDRVPPKSTGRELFNLDWLSHYLKDYEHLVVEDLLATLSEFTAWSISRDIQQYAAQCQRILVCGGGAFNQDLLQRLQRRCAITVESTEAYGLAPAWVEAVAFAWLAHQTMNQQPGNLPAVTGAQAPRILGAIFQA